jgi:hypothetical protein
MQNVRLRSRSMIGLLLTAGAALVAAFVFGPAALLSGTDGGFQDGAALPDAVGRGLVEYWQADRPEFPALLASLVDYWFRWHAIKVVISSVMLVVFVLLATALWQRYVDGVARSAVSAVGASVFSVLALGLLILNIQATAVPLVALLPLVKGDPGEMRPRADSPALSVLLGEVERYHWVMVAVAATAMVATALASAYFWKRRAAGDSRVRFMRRALGVELSLTAVVLFAVVAVSAISAFEPAGALPAVLSVG